MSENDGETRSATEQALEAGAANLPVAAPQAPVDVVAVREGMFGVSGSGDTSGYGGLERTVAMPAASQRPYGGWFDQAADALAEDLSSSGTGWDAASSCASASAAWSNQPP